MSNAVTAPPTTMRAAHATAYGAPEVVELVDAPTPTAAAGELLVRVRATLVGASDSAARRGEPRFVRLFFGLRRPRKALLGSEFAGEVVTGTTEFAAGTRVFGATGAAQGCHAEYIVVPAAGAIARTPAALSDAQAIALMDGGMTALPFLRDVGGIQPGHSVLVNGASGSVGSSAVILAKLLGARVTAVCSSANVELVTGLGADAVIAYDEHDFTTMPIGPFDLVFDAVGKSSFGRVKHLLTERGIYATTVPSLAIIVQQLFSRRARIAFTGLRKPEQKVPDLAYLASLDGYEPLIDSVRPFHEIRAAHARVDTGRKRGSVVVTL
jgi:NADPH:quinone reductase-like Zn-dependent oxidoreductase